MRENPKITKEQALDAAKFASHIRRYFKHIELLAQLHDEFEANRVEYEPLKDEFLNGMVFVAQKCVPDFLLDVESFITNGLGASFENLALIQKRYIELLERELHKYSLYAIGRNAVPRASDEVIALGQNLRERIAEIEEVLKV